MKRRLFLLLLVICFCQQLFSQEQSMSFDAVRGILRGDILNEAAWALSQKPITVTAVTSPRSSGDKHCFFSEGDYWWPDPENPRGPYIQRDGMTNPDNFVAHRKVMIRFSKVVGALVTAYLMSGDEKYLKPVKEHVHAWFIDPETFMEPHLKFAQAIKGRTPGRGIGIIDTIHLMEVAQSLKVLIDRDLIDTESSTKILQWFRDYLYWLTTSSNGIEEMNAKNNHGTCWVMQVASFAKLLNDTSTLSFCRDRYKKVLLPDQMANDGSFPLELKRTKPYGYSIFNLDAMTTVCQVLSTSNDNLWTYETSNGRSIKQALDFLFPYLKSKKDWPYPKDVMYWDEWPVALPSLVFGALQFNNHEWLDVWKRLDHNPSNEEVIRNLPIRHPLLWIEEK